MTTPERSGPLIGAPSTRPHSEAICAVQISFSGPTSTSTNAPDLHRLAVIGHSGPDDRSDDALGGDGAFAGRITKTPPPATSKAELRQKVPAVMDLVMNASLSSDRGEISWTTHLA